MKQPFSPPAAVAAAANPSGDARAAEVAALRLLARREHSTDELRRKLLRKGHAEHVVGPVLDKLTSKRLVSDERFAASFVHHHAKRGQGPVRIRMTLRQQGIPEERIDQEVELRPDHGGIDWLQRAREVRQRKFGAGLPRSLSERAKQARFLQYRGFDAEQIRAALNFDPSVDLDPALD